MLINEIIRNKKLLFDFSIIKEYEAGISLLGCEVNPIKNKKINIENSYIVIKSNNEAILTNTIVKISNQSLFCKEDDSRPKKLLLKKKELYEIASMLYKMRYTAKPISIYSKGSLIKVRIAICKGKKKYDKRLDMKEKTNKMEISKQMKNFNQ